MRLDAYPDDMLHFAIRSQNFVGIAFYIKYMWTVLHDKFPEEVTYDAMATKMSDVDSTEDFIAKNDFATNVKYYNGKLKELYDICDSLGVVFPSEQEDKHTYIDDKEKYVVKKFI